MQAQCMVKSFYCNHFVRLYILHPIYNQQNTEESFMHSVNKFEYSGMCVHFRKLTDLAVINIFHGVNVPTPCNINVKNINLHLSYGGLISILARSIVIPESIK